MWTINDFYYGIGKIGRTFLVCSSLEEKKYIVEIIGILRMLVSSGYLPQSITLQR